jgi:glycosyltransferase involved in cell wall biosynthesis
MKILLTTESYYPTIDGGAVAQHRLVHELVERDHDVRVIAPGTSLSPTCDDDRGSLIYRPRGYTLPFYMNGKYRFSPFPLPLVSKVIREFSPDVVNVCSPYPNSLCALPLAKKRRIPVVGSIHILPENILAPFLDTFAYRRLEAGMWSYLIAFYNRVDWATVPSQTGATMYQARGLRSNVSVISNGVNTTLFSPENDGSYLRERYRLPRKPLILYAGRINQEKNVDVLVKAIPAVLKTVDAHFLFCGSGGLKEEMVALTKTLGVADHTTFIDFLDGKDYPNIYALATAFVMPAESELQSIVTLEAVASGVPVVVVNKGAVPELASHGNGLVFEPRNSDQLAAHLVTILSDAKLRQSMKRKSIALSRAHTMSMVADRFEALYRTLIDGRRKG